MDSSSIPLRIWIRGRELKLIRADINGRHYSFYYEAMPTIGATDFSCNVSFESFLGFDSSDVTREFVKRLESIGGTIEDPND